MFVLRACVCVVPSRFFGRPHQQLSIAARMVRNGGHATHSSSSTGRNITSSTGHNLGINNTITATRSAYAIGGASTACNSSISGSNNGRSPTRKSRNQSGDRHQHHHHHHCDQQLQQLKSHASVVDTTGGGLVRSQSDDFSTASDAASVHKQNFYIVSYPIILLFNILRTILYQLFVVFRYIFSAGTRVLYRFPVESSRRRADFKLEVVNTTLSLGSDANIDGGQQQQLLTTSITSAGATDGIVGMSGVPKTSQGPGPGDPLLAKQKHHHRRAFEYISKALKLDEENEGEW